MRLRVEPDGTVTCLYCEDFDMSCLGDISMRRASHVEPQADGRWTADLSPVGGPVLGPFRLRSEALKAEAEWLEHNRL